MTKTTRPKIPEEYLALTIAEVLALHDPRRTRRGASVALVVTALHSLTRRITEAERPLEGGSLRAQRA
jgi:hypothetical protein